MKEFALKALAAFREASKTKRMLVAAAAVGAVCIALSPYTYIPAALSGMAFGHFLAHHAGRK